MSQEEYSNHRPEHEHPAEVEQRIRSQLESGFIEGLSREEFLRAQRRGLNIIAYVWDSRTEQYRTRVTVIEGTPAARVLMAIDAHVQGEFHLPHAQQLWDIFTTDAVKANDDAFQLRWFEAIHELPIPINHQPTQPDFPESEYSFTNPE